MQITTVAPDVHIVVGDTYASNTTVFVRDEDVLLVDAMGSSSDAEDLGRWIEDDLGKRVRFIISTHYFSDHLAALRRFPDAEIVAHALYMHTWTSERFRSREEEQHFVRPTITFDDHMNMRWGAQTLDLFHNPGHTMSTIGVDVAGVDLLHVGDTIVGNIAYIAYSAPEVIAAAIRRAQQRARRYVLTSHGTARGSAALAHAAAYLDRLTEQSARAVEAGTPDAIRSIAIDDCMPGGLKGSELENLYHLRNLETLHERAVASS
ncbi:MAG: MBL fold metallo-hydrolase [Acidobacteriota bacterium]